MNSYGRIVAALDINVYSSSQCSLEGEKLEARRRHI